MSKKSKIMILDDHQLFLDGLVRILRDEEDFEIAGFYNHSPTLLRALNREPPDLIILDVQLPKVSGIVIASQIKARYPQIKILFVSMFDASATISEGKAAGADGFIPKTADAAFVKDTIRQVLKGKKIFIHQEHEGIEENTPVSDCLLSKREREIIGLIKKGYRTKKIAEELNLSRYTVETHRKNIFRKLKLNSVAELVSFAFARNL